jgi:hypothetical protein
MVGILLERLMEVVAVVVDIGIIKLESDAPAPNIPPMGGAALDIIYD